VNSFHKRYVKHQCTDTINALDFEHLYLEIQQKYPALGKLCTIIEEFV
jgi:hypothetical protein